MTTLTCLQASVLRALTRPTTALMMGVTDEEPLSERRLSGRLISLEVMHAAEGVLVSDSVLDDDIMSELEAAVRSKLLFMSAALGEAAFVLPLYPLDLRARQADVMFRGTDRLQATRAAC